MNPPSGVIGNQFELDSSICHLGVAGFGGLAAVAITPPPGVYTASTPVSFLTSAKTTVLFREGGGAWTEWAGGLVLTQSTTLEFYGQHSSGLLSPIETAVYEIDQAFQFADANRDGLPDGYAKAFGLDPLGGGNADGDSFSDFDELLGGSDPNDPNDQPERSMLSTLVQFRVLDANSSEAWTGLGGRVTVYRLDGSFVAEAPVDRTGNASMWVALGAINGLGIAMFEAEMDEGGVVVQMAAGVVGNGFPDLATDNLSSEEWLKQTQTIIGGFKSMTGMDSETELIEISPQSTLGLLSFESWLGDAVPGVPSGLRFVPPSSFVIPEIDDEVLIAFNDDGIVAAYKLSDVLRRSHEAAVGNRIGEWNRGLAILYTNLRASPLLALRRLFFENEKSTSYGKELETLSLAKLGEEKVGLTQRSNGRPLEEISGKLSRVEGSCLVLTRSDGTTYLLAEANGAPYWPTAAIVQGSSATATGLLLTNTPHCAQHAFHLVSLSVVDSPVGTITDQDGDGVDDSYEEAFFGTLSFGAGDDPGGDGLTLLQAFSAGKPPSGGTVITPPASGVQQIRIAASEGGARNQLVLTWVAAPSTGFAIEASSNFATWTPAGGGVEESEPGVYRWTTNADPGQRLRFFRIVTKP